MNIVLENGEKIELTLNFGRLLQLKKENKQSMYSNKYTEFMSYFAKDIQEKNIIYMNFESAEWYNIKNYEDLYKRA